MLKEQFTLKLKFSQCLPTDMLKESQVKPRSPQNIPGASQQNCVAVIISSRKNWTESVQKNPIGKLYQVKVARLKLKLKLRLMLTFPHCSLFMQKIKIASLA